MLEEETEADKGKKQPIDVCLTGFGYWVLSVRVNRILTQPGGSATHCVALLGHSLDEK